MKTLVFFAFGLLTLNLEYKQGKENFKGQPLFEDCSENIAADFGETDSKIFLQTLQRLDSVELVWLNPIGHKKARYEFCYLVMDKENNYGLVKSKDFQNHSRLNLKTIPLEMEDYHFYKASCFRETLDKHPELRAYLKEK